MNRSHESNAQKVDEPDVQKPAEGTSSAKSRRSVFSLQVHIREVIVGVGLACVALAHYASDIRRSLGQNSYHELVTSDLEQLRHALKELKEYERQGVSGMDETTLRAQILVRVQGMEKICETAADRILGYETDYDSFRSDTAAAIMDANAELYELASQTDDSSGLANMVQEEPQRFTNTIDYCKQRLGLTDEECGYSDDDRKEHLMRGVQIAITAWNHRGPLGNSPQAQTIAKCLAPLLQDVEAGNLDSEAKKMLAPFGVTEIDKEMSDALFARSNELKFQNRNRQDSNTGPSDKEVAIR